jgi:hypothetical protein
MKEELAVQMKRVYDPLPFNFQERRVRLLTYFSVTLDAQTIGIVIHLHSAS